MAYVNRYGTRLLPREKGVPYTVEEIIARQVALEDEENWHVTAVPEIPKQFQVPAPKFTEVLKHNLSAAIHGVTRELKIITHP